MASGRKDGSPHFLTPESLVSKSGENNLNKNLDELTKDRNFLLGLMSSNSSKSGFACFPSTKKGFPVNGSNKGANSLKSSSMIVSSLTTMRISLTRLASCRRFPDGTVQKSFPVLGHQFWLNQLC